MKLLDFFKNRYRINESTNTWLIVAQYRPWWLPFYFYIYTTKYTGDSLSRLHPTDVEARQTCLEHSQGKRWYNEPEEYPKYIGVISTEE